MLCIWAGLSAGADLAWVALGSSPSWLCVLSAVVTWIIACQVFSPLCTSGVWHVLTCCVIWGQISGVGGAHQAALCRGPHSPVPTFSVSGGHALMRLKTHLQIAICQTVVATSVHMHALTCTA
jgi:hypothetical protein